MVLDKKTLYKFHVENNRSIEIALKHSALAARSAIGEQNESAIKSFVSLNSFLLGAWAENRLRKILCEDSNLSDDEIGIVRAETSQLGKWQKLIEVAFRKHYLVPKVTLSEHSLPFTAAARYKVLNEVLNQDLRSVIEIRNKLAHGQWVYPLQDESKLDGEKKRALERENLPSLQYKKSLLTSLSNIINDLIVSVTTFERDFDNNYKKISQTRCNLKNRNYQKYATSLIDKRQRGLAARKFRGPSA